MEYKRNANKLTKRAKDAEVANDLLEIKNEKLEKEMEIISKEHKAWLINVKELTEGRRLAEEHMKKA